MLKQITLGFTASLLLLTTACTSSVPTQEQSNLAPRQTQSESTGPIQALYDAENKAVVSTLILENLKDDLPDDLQKSVETHVKDNKEFINNIPYFFVNYETKIPKNIMNYVIQDKFTRTDFGIVAIANNTEFIQETKLTPEELKSIRTSIGDLGDIAGINWKIIDRIRDELR